jgi:hypothetical protein
VTLYYREDVNGGLLMPAGGGAGPSVDPLLAEAVWLLRASTGTGENEGTAGAVLDAAAVCMDGSVELAAGFVGGEANAATCPDAAALDLTTGFVVWVDMTADWQPAIPQQILAKPRTGDATTNDCYAVGFDNAGHPFVEWYDNTDGHVAPAFITDNGATSTVTFAAGAARRQIGFEWLSTAQGYTARFYTGTPESHTLVSEIVNTTVGAQTIETSTDNLRIGDPVTGAIYRVRLYGTLGGALLRDFYPDRDYVSGTTMTAGTGEVWSGVLTDDDALFVSATVPDDSALDVAADADASWAFRFTQNNVANVDGELFVLANRDTGNMGVNGVGFRLLDIKVAAYSSDFAGVVVGDGTDFGFGVGSHWAAGTHTVVVTIDRDTDLMNVYVDGAANGASPVDISAVGALDPAADLTLGAAFHHAAAKWDRVLTADEIAALPYLLA